MIRFVLALVVLLTFAVSADAHHGGSRVVLIEDAFGNVRAVRVRSAPPVHHGNFFNQNGGRNRFGFRR